MIGMPCSMRLIEPDSIKRADDISLKVTVECAAVARATCRQLSRLVAGSPQLIRMRLRRVENSNERQPACASWLTASAGGRPVSIRTTVPVASRSLCDSIRSTGPSMATYTAVDGTSAAGGRPLATAVSTAAARARTLG